MKHLLVSLIFLILLLGTQVHASSWSYIGYFKAGDKLVINENTTITIDYDKHKHVYFAIIENPDKKQVIVINDTRDVYIPKVMIRFTEFNNQTVISIQSENPLSIVVNPKESSISKYISEISKLKNKIAELTKENEQLNEKIKELNQKLSQNGKQQSTQTKQPQNFNQLQLKILNLTKENRKLKEELANLTKKYNALKGENQYLKEQLKTYQAVFSGLVSRVEQHAESDYIEQAKKSKKTAERLFISIILSGLFVGGFGLLLYRKKRKYYLE
ncbi:hypothetical protein PNA2_1315 [Pyrococcus sp. NA2]|uniref:hypothetical protein n=1 Tax=Pyrococcus sp. (strain NA2) TaxID=342949 RepID=UPI000209AD73|nr:hypothetical protein [Pyrococcus sp. NA2]AEC52230.1 hypothetical protein PNA2_1315 [Pyrococcus sp. NA2]